MYVAPSLVGAGLSKYSGTPCCTTSYVCGSGRGRCVFDWWYDQGIAPLDTIEGVKMYRYPLDTIIAAVCRGCWCTWWDKQWLASRLCGTGRVKCSQSIKYKQQYTTYSIYIKFIRIYVYGIEKLMGHVSLHISDCWSIGGISPTFLSLFWRQYSRNAATVAGSSPVKNVVVEIFWRREYMHSGKPLCLADTDIQ